MCVCMFTDPEQIHMEVTGNSHNSNTDHKLSNKIPEEGEEEEDAAAKPAPSARKEKSVLQSKLTKLAIQIGYGGTMVFLIFFTKSIFLSTYCLRIYEYWPETTK